MNEDAMLALCLCSAIVGTVSLIVSIAGFVGRRRR